MGRIAPKDAINPQIGDKGVSFGKAGHLIKLGDRLGFVTIDLFDIEHVESAGENAGVRSFGITAVIFSVRICCAILLPKHHRRAMLALANLRAFSLPLPVGAPKAFGKTAALGQSLECKHIDAPVRALRSEVDRA